MEKEDEILSAGEVERLEGYHISVSPSFDEEAVGAVEDDVLENLKEKENAGIKISIPNTKKVPQQQQQEDGDDEEEEEYNTNACNAHKHSNDEADIQEKEWLFDSNHDIKEQENVNIEKSQPIPISSSLPTQQSLQSPKKQTVSPAASSWFPSKLIPGILRETITNATVSVKTKIQNRRNKAKEKSKWKSCNIMFISNGIAVLHPTSVAHLKNTIEFPTSSFFKKAADDAIRVACNALVNEYGNNVRIFDVDYGISTDEPFSSRVVKLNMNSSIETLLLFMETTLKWLSADSYDTNVNIVAEDTSTGNSASSMKDKYSSPTRKRNTNTGHVDQLPAATTTADNIDRDQQSERVILFVSHSQSTLGVLVSTFLVNGKNASWLNDPHLLERFTATSSAEEGGVEHPMNSFEENHHKVESVQASATSDHHIKSPKKIQSHETPNQRNSISSKPKSVYDYVIQAVNEMYHYQAHINSSHLPIAIIQPFASPPPASDIRLAYMLVRNWNLWLSHRNQLRLKSVYNSLLSNQINADDDFKSRKLCLRFVILRHAPRVNSKRTGCRPYFIVSNSHSTQIHYSSLVQGIRQYSFSEQVPVFFEVNRVVQDDLYFKFYHSRLSRAAKKMFEFRLHTSCIEPLPHPQISEFENQGEHLIYYRISRIYLDEIAAVDTSYTDDFDVHLLFSLNPKSEWSDNDIKRVNNGEEIPLKKCISEFSDASIANLNQTVVPKLSSLDLRKCWIRTTSAGGKYVYPTNTTEASDSMPEDIKQSNLPPMQMICSRLTCGYRFWIHKHLECFKSSFVDDALGSIFGSTNNNSSSSRPQIRPHVNRHPLARPFTVGSVECPQCHLFQVPWLEMILSRPKLHSVLNTQINNANAAASPSQQPNQNWEEQVEVVKPNLGGQEMSPDASDGLRPRQGLGTNISEMRKNAAKEKCKVLIDMFPKLPHKFILLNIHALSIDSVSVADMDDRIQEFILECIQIQDDQSLLSNLYSAFLFSEMKVKTPYGIGEIDGSIKEEHGLPAKEESFLNFSLSTSEDEDDMIIQSVKIKYPWGIGYLNPNAIEFPSTNVEAEIEEEYSTQSSIPPIQLPPALIGTVSQQNRANDAIVSSQQSTININNSNTSANANSGSATTSASSSHHISFFSSIFG